MYTLILKEISFEREFQDSQLEFQKRSSVLNSKHDEMNVVVKNKQHIELCKLQNIIVIDMKNHLIDSYISNGFSQPLHL